MQEESSNSGIAPPLLSMASQWAFHYLQFTSPLPQTLPTVVGALQPQQKRGQENGQQHNPLSPQIGEN
jgi:hypothetical protein